MPVRAWRPEQRHVSGMAAELGGSLMEVDDRAVVVSGLGPVSVPERLGRPAVDRGRRTRFFVGAGTTERTTLARRFKTPGMPRLMSGQADELSVGPSRDAVLGYA